MKTQTISKTIATTMITENPGKVFTATWEKNNGKNRTATCSFEKGNQTPLGYIVVSTEDGYRTINPKTLKSIKMEGTTYKVK